MSHPARARSAFTIVEMLVVVALISAISFAIYATLANGVRVWRRVNTRIADEDLTVFFRRFAADARHCFESPNAPFLGLEDQVTFAAIVPSKRLNIKTIGKVSYTYKSGGGTLNREVLDASQIYADDGSADRQSVGNIRSLRFSYYSYDDTQRTYVWTDSWDGGGVPIALRAEFTLDDGSRSIDYVQTAPIPVGS